MDSKRNRLVNHILMLQQKYDKMIIGSPDYQNELYFMACMDEEELKLKCDKLDEQYKQPKKLTEQLYG